MKKQMTTGEMANRFWGYLGATLVLIIVSVLLFGFGVLFNANTDWKTTGWIIIIIAIGCFVSAIGFFIRTLHWQNKANGL